MNVLIGIFCAWAIAWTVVIFHAPALWVVAALGFAQNLAFTFVSRGRNSGSLVYHMVASIFSNGIWLGMFVVGVKIASEAPTFPTEFAIVYVLSTMAGSVFAHWLARRVERGAARNVQEDRVQALEKRLIDLETLAEHAEVADFEGALRGALRRIESLEENDPTPGLLNGLDDHEGRLKSLERTREDTNRILGDVFKRLCKLETVDLSEGNTLESLELSLAAHIKRIEALEERIQEIRESPESGTSRYIGLANLVGVLEGKVRHLWEAATIRAAYPETGNDLEGRIAWLEAERLVDRVAKLENVDLGGTIRAHLQPTYKRLAKLEGDVRDVESDVLSLERDR
jgi:hypothetical protein